MKTKLFILVSLLAFGCQKDKLPFESQIQGTWKLDQARTSGMDHWESFLESEDLVQISASHVSNPWDRNYSVVSDGTITLLADSVHYDIFTVKVEINENQMLWVFDNNDSLKMIKQ